ncbi:MAG: glycine zipper domain-containing protein, partial [Bacteroidales bacterium]|nr:glycine zipper domain-containing protein [Bacteroidales bacterium]
MKKMKFSVCAVSLAMLLSSCGMSNTAKGGLIGGAGGGALGALVGQLVGGNGKSTAIGAAVGTVVGAGAGVLIGNKMDKAKKAAVLANAEALVLTDQNGTQYVKA